jgi:hypothetical protein
VIESFTTKGRPRQKHKLNDDDEASFSTLKLTPLKKHKKLIYRKQMPVSSENQEIFVRQIRSSPSCENMMMHRRDKNSLDKPIHHH